MRVTSKGQKEKINPDKFLDSYPPGPRNCFDCKNLRLRASLDKDRKINWNGCLVRCRKNFLLAEDFIGKRAGGQRGHIREHEIVFNSHQWNLIKKGWRHPIWNAANVCGDFESMVDDDQITGIWFDESAPVSKEDFDQLIESQKKEV